MMSQDQLRSSWTHGLSSLKKEVRDTTNKAAYQRRNFEIRQQDRSPLGIRSDPRKVQGTRFMLPPNVQIKLRKIVSKKEGSKDQHTGRRSKKRQHDNGEKA